MSDSDPATIADIRKGIDKADRNLLQILAWRFQMVDMLRRAKRLYKAPVKDLKREEEVKAKWKQQAKKLKLREELALMILDFILDESKRLQEQ